MFYPPQRRLGVKQRNQYCVQIQLEAKEREIEAMMAYVEPMMLERTFKGCIILALIKVRMTNLVEMRETKGWMAQTLRHPAEYRRVKRAD